MRGLVIMLMALDHVRDFFHLGAFLYQPLDVATTTPALYVTRWITHLCAPTFVLLAGISAWLQGDKRRDPPALARFLVTRGLWLAFLEFGVISFAWHFTANGAQLGVIWAIGMSMVLLAPFAWAGPGAALAVGLLLIFGHNLLDGLDPATTAAPVVVRLLIGPAAIIGAFPVEVGYPVLPWTGIMLVGFGLGPLFGRPAGERDRVLRLVGIGALVLFTLLRASHGYGDPLPWQERGDAAATLGAALDVLKYPPSLHYTLVTLGLSLLILSTADHWPAWASDRLLVFGRVPLFFYLGHLYLIHLAELGSGVAAGYPPELFTDLFLGGGERMSAAGWGVPLWAVYAIWVGVLAAMYGPCRWFGRIKASRKDWWMSYL